MIAKSPPTIEIELAEPSPKKVDDANMQNPFSPEAINLASPSSTVSHSKPPADYDPELEASDIKLKKSLSLPSLGLLIGESYSLIAFQAGSFGLRGALIQNAKHQAKIKAVAQSDTVDFTRAIAEVMTDLKAQHKKLPKQAILLTPSVVSALVQLPVSPLRPRTDEQMQELIRWELEGAISQQNKHWMIGSMLVERGSLSIDQRDEIVSELQIRQNQGGPASLTRFGDLAVQLGYINRDQLEECFTLQGKLVAIDDDLVYGWQDSDFKAKGPSDEALMSQEDDSDSAHPWLVSGISLSVRKRWLGAFKLNGIHLEAFYPSLGSAFANLCQHSDQEQQLLLEIHQQQIALISGSGKVVTSIATTQRDPGPISSQQCLDLIGILPSDTRRLYITDNSGNNILKLMSELVEHLGCDIQQFNGDKTDIALPKGITADALIGLQGAANHFLKHIPGTRLSWINSRESKESTLKRITKPKNIIIAVSSCALIAASGFLVWMYWNGQVQTQRLAELELKFERDSKVKAQLEAIHSQTKTIKTDIATTNQEIDKNLTLVEQLQNDRGYRRLTTSPLLKTMILAIRPQIVLTSINKTEDHWSLTANTTDNNSGNEFINTLMKLIKPIDYQVIDSSVVLADNNLYQIKLSMAYQTGLHLKLATGTSAKAVFTADTHSEEAN